MERRDEPVDAKVCSRCNMDKHNSEYYRDSSKPDGLQVSCAGRALLLPGQTHLSLLEIAPRGDSPLAWLFLNLVVPLNCQLWSRRQLRNGPR